MGRDTYSTPLTLVSSDIKKVGGKDAYLGMVREDEFGKQYKLVQSYDVVADISGFRLILGYKGGQPYKVTLAAASGRCNGVTILRPSNLPALAAGDYMWMQVSGRADNVYVTSGDQGAYIASNGSGLGISCTASNSLSVIGVVTDDAVTAYTLTNTGVIGWCISNAVSNLCSIEVEPGFVWTGTVGGPLAVSTGDGA